MEREHRVTDSDRGAVAERGVGDALAADEGSVLTAEIAQSIAAVTGFDGRVMTGDGGVSYNDIVIERTSDARRHAWPHYESITVDPRQINAAAG